ncbi:hypothetical protein Hanom_Chr10g00929101 [Helianthus anomalus]
MRKSKGTYIHKSCIRFKRSHRSSKPSMDAAVVAIIKYVIDMVMDTIHHCFHCGHPPFLFLCFNLCFTV